MPITEALRNLYKSANQSGIVIREYSAEEGYVAGAGNKDRLNRKGFDKEAINALSVRDAAFYMAMGGGETREEAVRNAIEALKSYNEW